MTKFTTGDLVQLKSGGPVMTVEEESYDKTGVWCQWFSGKKLERGQFPYGSVQVPKDDDAD